MLGPLEFFCARGRTEWLRQGLGGLWTTSRGGRFWTRSAAVTHLEKT